MPDQTSTPQSKSIYHNIANGKTIADKLEIINHNAFYIDVICDLIEGYDDSITSEPKDHAIGLIQRLEREITIKYAGLHDYLSAKGF